MIVLEPRGSEALVGALLCPPVEHDSASGVIFFNNTGYLGMCGHGAIGVAVTLAHLGRVEPNASVKLETPVGLVSIDLNGANEASLENVASYCYRENVVISLANRELVKGDIAWGGNWFFLSNDAPAPLTLENTTSLTQAASEIRSSLKNQGITGADGAEIDHVEFFSDPISAEANSRNFVLCPGGAYDRSPCGTGTSAKLACLAKKGLLLPGEPWVQESVIGSRFTAKYRPDTANTIVCTIGARAFVIAESTIVRQTNDPYINGIM